MTVKKQIWQNDYVKGIVILILSSLITWGMTQYRKHERDKVDQQKQKDNDSIQNSRINTLYKLLEKKLDKNVFEQYEQDQKH